MNHPPFLEAGYLPGWIALASDIFGRSHREPDSIAARHAHFDDLLGQRGLLAWGIQLASSAAFL